MKHLISCTLFALAPLMAERTQAQIALSVHGTAAATTISKSNIRPGGGLNLKLFLLPFTSVGIAAKYIMMEYEESASGTGDRIESTGSMIPLTFTAEQYLSRGPVRPYIGAEAGAYLRSTEVKRNGKKVSDDRVSRFGATPKIGIALAVGNLAIFLEGNYHFIFGSKDGSIDNGSLSNISYRNPDKLFGINAGLTFGFPR